MAGIAQHWSMANVAGDGENAGGAGFIEGADALNTPIGRPTALAIDPSNNLYFGVVGYGAASISGIYRINKVDNIINHLYDNIEGIAGLDIDLEGNIYYSRGGNSVLDIVVPEYIYKISTSGDITTIAGNGINEAPPIETSSVDTNMGNAASLRLGPNEEYLYYTAPYLGATSDGLAWVNYIQRINLADETTERYVGAGAGNGVTDAVNGDLAVSADIAMGFGMDWDTKGNFYFGTYDHQIKKVIDGKIYHVAGTGVAGFEGDEGPAGVAQLNLSTSGFHITEGDVLILCDTKNNRIRKFQLSTNSIEEDGTITTFCGTGEDEASGPETGNLYNGFFKLAIEANIEPYDIIMLNNEIYFSDKDYRIRRAFVCKNPEITGHVLSSDVICKDDAIEIILDADIGDAVSWKWYEGGCQEGDPLTDESEKNLEVVVTESTTYHIIGTGGCSNVTVCYDVDFNVACEEFYNAITPNLDGLNDFVVIPALNSFATNTVTFYNRWGDILGEFENYDNSAVVWRGTNRDGDNVDSGTYYFTAVSGSELITSGWIQVIREQ